MSLSRDGTFLSFNTSVGQAEQLLGAEFHLYRHVNGTTTQTASERYSLPSRVARYIDYVLPAPDPDPVSSAPQSVAVQPNGGIDARQIREIDCLQYIAPHCLRQLYNMDDGAGQTAHPNNSLGVYTPAYSAWVAEDLDMFFGDFAPDLVGRWPEFMSIAGGWHNTEYQLPTFNLEPNLDYQYTMALAKPIPVTNIQVGDPVVQGNLNIMLGAFNAHYCRTGLDPQFDPVYPNPAPGGYNASDCGTHVPPRVVAIMYAWNEAWYSDAYARRQCLEFLKLGLQGVTVLTGSADRGPADQLAYCINPDDPKNSTVSEGYFASVFPASCPWVTSVGGTQFLAVVSNGSSSATSGSGGVASSSSFPGETALDDNNTVSSGGGFSRLFPAPWYQGDLTREYLASAPGAAELARQGYFNPSGRGYPDISAMARSFLVALHGGYRSVSGTSASTPVVAAMVAKINDARLHAGKSTVGFLNPVLYSNAARKAGVLRDIQLGKNHGCGVNEAFPARRAWDAVTGLGTPDFEKLKEFYLRLP
jgi:tripeptidyl-peptidase-1